MEQVLGRFPWPRDAVFGSFEGLRAAKFGPGSLHEGAATSRPLTNSCVGCLPGISGCASSSSSSFRFERFGRGSIDLSTHHGQAHWCLFGV